MGQVLRREEERAKGQVLQETSKASLQSALRNPSKARFSTRNTSHVLANEPALSGLRLVGCRLATSRHNIYNGSFELRTSDLLRRQGQAKRQPTQNLNPATGIRPKI